MDFRNSPFEEVLKILVQPILCRVNCDYMKRYPKVSSLKKTFNLPEITFKHDDPNVNKNKVILKLIQLEPQNKPEISYYHKNTPAYLEIRINNQKLKIPSLLDGPDFVIDVTNDVNFDHSIKNNVHIKWRFNKLEYKICIFLIDKFSELSLFEDVKWNHQLKTSQTLIFFENYFKKHTGPKLLSLLDPISLTIMKYPGRSINCRHSQCFDIVQFLILNKQKMHWKCPVCNMRVTIEQLQYDLYLGKIISLLTRPEYCEKIVFYKEGWKWYDSWITPREHASRPIVGRLNI